MSTTLVLTGIDVTETLHWKSLRTREQIGAPDELTAEVSDFRVGAGEEEASLPPAPEDLAADPGDTVVGLTWSAIPGSPGQSGLYNLLAFPESVLAAVVERDGDVRFSGLVKARGGKKPAKGVITWTLTGVGWEALAAKRLVGTPAGDTYDIQEDGDEDRLPTGVATDGAATGTAHPDSIAALWGWKWAFPPIDVQTYVFPILPDEAPIPDNITWSGSDLAGATSDLCALGSAAARWFFRNDAPVLGSALAPHLALHVAVLALPDEGDDGDDLLAGFPSADQPIDVAPYKIDNDNPQWGAPSDDAEPGDSILPTEINLEYEIGERDDAVYVRGATGFTLEILGAPISFPVPYQVGPVIEGGTGWVGTPRQTVWGERYIDAPGAVTPAQRDAFGNAHLAANSLAKITGTIKVVGWHGFHKGQAVRVTDADYGLAGRWLLIQGVEAIQHDPVGDADEFTLTVGDSMPPDLGYALRDQRLAEQRKEIKPATRFIPYVGDLTLDPEETAALTMQLANDAGKAMAVKGVGARWGLIVNGVNLSDPEDAGAAFFLTNLVTVTDEFGQITATLNANATATADDAAKPWAEIAAPP